MVYKIFFTVSLRAHENDEMSVVASEGALLDSNDKGLPDVMPLQSNPQDKADSKLAMMLARAVASI